MKQCPYCKLSFVEFPKLHTKNVICWNCRNYHDATQAQKREREERALFRLFGSLPWEWENDPKYRAALDATTSSGIFDGSTTT